MSSSALDDKELDKIKVEYLHKINTYKEFLKDKRINKDEYDELIGDLLQLDNIKDSIRTEDLKIKAEAVVKSLLSIASAI
jgi:hypothetical protein|tara:strand:+ start:2506 stop:2745 length:240 start_codon:yes stop_codon:yes gene_type:complete